MEAVALKTPSPNNKKKLSLILLGAIIATGALVAFLLIALTNLGSPKITGKKAASITIPVSSGGSCPAGGARCTWTFKGTGEVTYKYTITDENTKLVEATGVTSATSVSFTPKPDHKYTCTVSVVNNCGESPTKSATNTCTTVITSPTPTPTAGPSATPTPTNKPGVTPTPTNPPTGGPSATPTITPSVTPTPTSGPSATPTPTNKPGVTPTPTEIVIVITATPRPGVTTIVAQPTTTPVPPVSGSLIPSLALIGTSIFIIVLGLVL